MLSQVPIWRSLLGWLTHSEKYAAMQALAKVGMAEYAAQRASTLSGGQQQRAAIACALAQKAKEGLDIYSKIKKKKKEEIDWDDTCIEVNMPAPQLAVSKV